MYYVDAEMPKWEGEELLFRVMLRKQDMGLFSRARSGSGQRLHPLTTRNGSSISTTSNSRTTERFRY